MKTTITLFFLLISFAVNVKSQDNIVTLEIQAGGLEAAIPQEQWKKVQELTLKGSMNDADFYFMRDKLTGLITVDLKQVEADTIPKEAFCNSTCQKCILPLEVKYIGDNAFHKGKSVIEEIIITGNFPKLGADIFGAECKRKWVPFQVSNENRICKQINNNIYSLDGKTFYYYQYDFYPGCIIEEGTEIIESKAFDYAFFADTTFPSTLKLIKENAFYNVELALIDNIGNDDNIYINCNAEIPPILEKNAFNSKNFSYVLLNVPPNKVNIYKEADPQWSLFKEIRDVTSINYNTIPFLRIEKIVSGIQIESEKEINSIQITTLEGKFCNFPIYRENTIYKVTVPISGIYLLKTVFEDGSTKTIKFID